MPPKSAVSRQLSIVSCFLFLALVLSGCSAVGFQKLAALQVTSTPQASIFLDGKFLGSTPFYSDQLKRGIYDLKITTPDSAYKNKLELSDNTLTVVDWDLAANFLAQSGSILNLLSGGRGLVVTSLPADADVTIDGRYSGKTPVQITDITAGEHKVQLSKSAYVSREFAIKTLPRYQLIAQVTLASKIAKGQGTDISQPEASGAAKIEIAKFAQNFVPVKKEPADASSDIGRAKAGQQLDLTGESQDWFQVILEGKQGWIPKKSVKKL